MSCAEHIQPAAARVRSRSSKPRPWPPPPDSRTASCHFGSDAEPSTRHAARCRVGVPTVPNQTISRHGKRVNKLLIGCPHDVDSFKTAQFHSNSLHNAQNFARIWTKIAQSREASFLVSDLKPGGRPYILSILVSFRGIMAYIMVIGPTASR